MAIKCPSCQFEQADDRVDCECCGLIFSKWKERYAPSPAENGEAGKKTSEAVRLETSTARVGYLYQQLAAMDFQETIDGSWIYFPWGSFGKGYDGNDPGLRNKILRYVSIFSAIHCPSLAILWTLNLLAWLYYPNYRLIFAVYFLLYLGTAYGLFWFASKKWISKLLPSGGSFDQKQYLKGLGMIFYWKYLVSFEVLSLFFLIAGIWLWLTGNFFIIFQSHPVFAQRFWLIFSVVTLFTSTYLIYAREKKKI